ncbi:hypothetical protein D0860_01635 [Hortaea werneckii]|uniref:Tyrosinase copper-binding domain-containing protein n=1 Tax=Hortaea werneckii TaxID=91943 RepID=A0A3M7HQ11_HORWE|nr:hypothetical protein D0860_01635 [Hortaea werneckii]
MKLQNILGASLLIGGGADVAQASQEAAKDAIESVAERTKAAVLEQVDNQAAKRRECGTEPSCTRDKLVFRREYGSLSEVERLEYVDAVKCLQQLPPRTPSTAAAGAKSRFDDFVVTHINQTLTIHFTGNFMPWNRWFVHEYEKALREECGYTGYQPYWDWPRYASAPQDSPIFDGSPTSLGGNGEYVVHDGPVISPPEGFGGGDIQLPAGVGGGYVTTGPFANMTVNLGPVGGLNGTNPGPDGGLGYNPRRLKRDVGPAMNTRYANYTTVMTTDNCFRQLLDPETRFTESSMNNGTYGHITWANQPESRKTHFNDTIDMGYAGDSISIGEVMSTTSGPFCYFYL